MALFLTKGIKCKPSTPYLRHASFAVVFEQEGNFANAALRWEQARNVAIKEVDRVWADERRAFCSNAQAKGWGPQYAGDGVQ